MCSLPRINQATSHTPYSLNTVEKSLRRVCKGDEFPKETSLSHYKDYLKKRLETAPSNCVSTRKLFNEIIAKGYRGSFSAVEKFLWVIRKQTKAPKEASIQFHKEYLIKRIKDASPDLVLGTELFKEIRAQGYRGSMSTLQAFLSMLRKKEKRPGEVSLDFHKSYLIKRIKETYPKCVSGKQLFEEIQAKGYRGSIITLQGFLLMLRKQEKKPSKDLNSASVEFHKDYLIKRLEETYPSYASGKELFQEIRTKGYRGSLSTLQRFLSILRKQEKKPSEACVRFHKEYLSKRLEETYPSYASGKELFQEIRTKGYRGSLSTLQRFLSILRKQEKKPSEAYVRFHKEYLSKRIKDALPHFVPAQKLFEEITDRGYRGRFNTLQIFLSALREQEESPDVDRGSLVQRNVLPEESLHFHKDYLIKRLQETRPNCLPLEQLFEDIISRGYRGTCKEVEVFLMMISK